MKAARKARPNRAPVSSDEELRCVRRVGKGEFDVGGLARRDVMSPRPPTASRRIVRLERVSHWVLEVDRGTQVSES